MITGPELVGTSGETKQMSNLANQKVTVLYIASPGRSGSTLMERVLNEIPDFFAAGELGLSIPKFKKERICVCGKSLDECPVWKNIINDAAFKTIDLKELARQSGKYNHGVVTIFNLLIQKLPDDFKQYLNNLQIVYSTIHKHLSCKVMTDSTILPFYGHFLSLIPSIDLYVVHLVRDPRGVVHSWNTVKYTSKNVPWSPKINPLKSAFTWMKRNCFTEIIFSRKQERYLRIHYEDFVENPTKIIMQIGEMLGIKSEESLDFIDGKNLELGGSHLSAGNIDAMNKGKEEIVLKLDERWKRDMKWWNIVLVTLITWPLLLKYFIADKIMKKKPV